MNFPTSTEVKLHWPKANKQSVLDHRACWFGRESSEPLVWTKADVVTLSAWRKMASVWAAKTHQTVGVRGNAPMLRMDCETSFAGSNPAALTNLTTTVAVLIMQVIKTLSGETSHEPVSATASF